MSVIQIIHPDRMRRQSRLASLLLAMLWLANTGQLPAQEGEGASEMTAEEAAELLSITVVNRLTGRPLDATSPAPHRGQLGDGLPDKLAYEIKIEFFAPPHLAPEEFFNTSAVMLQVKDPANPETAYSSGIMNVGVGPVGAHEGMPSRLYLTAGEIDVPFDMDVGRIYTLSALLFYDNVPVDTFTTQFTPGNPELGIRSTITSGGGGRTAMEMTGRISGTTALEFSSDYSRLSGRGTIDYEVFEFRPPDPSCSASTTWVGGYWRALEIVLAERSNESDVSLDGIGGFLPVVEAVVALDPSIDETATLQCGPMTVGVPGLKHFFPAFYSIHGEEMDEERGGLVMTEWLPGEGSLIASRTYDRRVSIGGVAITERTTLELRWP